MKIFKPQQPDNNNQQMNESGFNSEIKIIPPFKANTSSTQNQSKGEELFNAFTADIIKKETLFTR